MQYVNLSHEDIIDADTVATGNGMRVLAGNDVTNVQALAAGDAIRGVQFHPEFRGATMRAYIEARSDQFSDSEALAARARDSEHGVRVFTNFMRHWIQRA